MTDEYRLGVNLGKAPDYIDGITQVVLESEGILSEEGFILDTDNLTSGTNFKILEYMHPSRTVEPSGIRILYRSFIEGKSPDYSLNFKKGPCGRVVGQFSDLVHIFYDFRFIDGEFRENFVKDIQGSVDSVSNSIIS